MGKKGAKESKAGDGEALWEEIQKLGGDMADLDMLRDVDTDGPVESGKGAKIDKASLHGDLTEFAKSLGLTTSVPEFVNPTKDKPAKKDKKSKKAEKIERPEKPAKAERPVKPVKEEKPGKPAKIEKQEKAGKLKKDKKDKRQTEKNDAPAKQEKAEEAEKIPGFKIKSAMDAQPLGKATQLAVEPSHQWYTVELPELTVDDGAERPSEDEVVRKLEYAEQMLEVENALYEKRGLRQKSLSTSDRSFVSNILSSGTLTDRVSALTLIVQESPVHNIKALGQLMQMVQKKNRREALMAVSSVKDLMGNSLLPDTRKLRHFADQPLNASNVTRAHWIMWAFEDRLKRSYFDLIQVMESMSYDPVLHTRQNMVAFFESLLEQKPEQEQNLLRLLVNKLGDKERQLAAKASYLVLKLLNMHPNMKLVVVRTVRELLLSKSATKERAQYYTMITLNQIILSSRDVETANLLLEVYFAFFKQLLKIVQDDEDGEEEPTKKTGEKAGKKDDKKPAKVYIGQKALKKAKAEAEKQRAEEERSMDNKLMVAVLTGLNRALPFAQMDDARMDAHVGTVFQVAHAGNFNTVVQSLVLLQQIARVRPAIGDRFYRTLYDSLLDPRLDHTSKKAMYLNVLFRALKSDTSIARVSAFVKRIMQVCLHSQAEFASGALFVVSQVLELHPQLYDMVSQSDDNKADDKPEAKPEEKPEEKPEYDALKRDPRYAHAESSCAWEATLLLRHFHPSVTHTMQQIVDRQPVPAITNLHNHSLAHFLDRFVFRKPKVENAQTAVLRGQSLMQPLLAASGMAATTDHLIASKRTGGPIGSLDLTSGSIADMKKSDILPDEQFFHQFFQTKRQRMGKRQKKKAADADGELELADDDTGFAGALKDDVDDDEAWKAMSASMPDIAGEELDDDDDDDDDLLAALREDEDSDDASEDDASGGEASDAESGSDGAASGSDTDDDGFPNFDDEISSAEAGSEDEAAAGAKRKSAESDKPSKRKKKERVPLVASFDDYAHLIDSNEGLE
ncbi:RNA-binding ribosome biosynthesis protein mak21 [Coemansia sp. RSA 2706]|nr:RNA-binding ribosome biosynthesis protein mak21 [Coemansia sp. RSA 2711]KAJ2305544.1 RNA-binding ribosome biosynthesis protein mak21 [Coemansia sp. RSA 2706]